MALLVNSPSKLAFVALRISKVLFTGKEKDVDIDLVNISEDPLIIIP